MTKRKARKVKYPELARRLKELMGVNKWSQSELGRQAGVERAMINTYYHGYNAPSPENLVKVARALGVEPGDMLPEAPHDQGTAAQMPETETVVVTLTPKQFARIAPLLGAEAPVDIFS